MEAIYEALESLVGNGIELKATAVALRLKLDEDCSKVQVLDNSSGIPVNQLKFLGEEISPGDAGKLKESGFFKAHQVYEMIVGVCSVLHLMTQCQDSPETYEKIFRKNSSGAVNKTINRLSIGTTTTIYFYHDQERSVGPEDASKAFDWDRIKKMIGQFALQHPQVSFTICDDKKRELVLGIRKYTKLDVLHKIAGSENPQQIYKINSEAIRKSFKKEISLNYKKSISNNFNLEVSNESLLVRKRRKQIFKFKNQFGKLNYPKEILTLPLVLRETSFDRKLSTFFPIRKKCQVAGNEAKSSAKIDEAKSEAEDLGLQPKEPTQKVEENIVKLSQEIQNINFELDGIEWSDWELDPPQETHNLKPTKRFFTFLPESLHKLLPRMNKKLLDNRKLLKTNEMFDELNLIREDLYVRLCQLRKSEMPEVTLDKNSLSNMTVLNQVNSEFIAAVTQQNNKKLLILIDQHAMDERIRYESLFEDYKSGDTFIPAYLKHPMIISELPEDISNVLLRNDKILETFGVQLRVHNHQNITQKSQSMISLAIYTIPKCFLSKKHYVTETSWEVIQKMKKLLLEIGNKLINRTGVLSLPMAIHNSVASEACRGAIKFGHPLTFKQCEELVSYWKETDLPNRCAHGRPVILPVMAIDPHTDRNHKMKLKFKNLKRISLS